jgi:hypothetical protein
MRQHTVQTLAILRENLRLAHEVRQGALERGNLDIVAIEDETITRLEQHIARIEAVALSLDITVERQAIAAEQGRDWQGRRPSGLACPVAGVARR